MMQKLSVYFHLLINLSSYSFSGGRSAIVTNTTVEILVPESVIGSVYGENGSNLAQLRQVLHASFRYKLVLLHQGFCESATLTWSVCIELCYLECRLF